jgi:hypothetical protein
MEDNGLTTLEPGVYTMPVQLEIPGEVTVENDISVRVTVMMGDEDQ